MAAEVIAAAAIMSGKFAASFPLFTAERRGAAVTSFSRIDDQPIREKTQIYTPDCVIVLDPYQRKSPNVYQGVKSAGILVANSPKEVPEKPHQHIGLAGIIDATKISLEELGMPAFNTCMVGAFAATTSWIELDSLIACLGNYFTGEALRKNRKSAERGYHEVRIVEWEQSPSVVEEPYQPVRMGQPTRYESAWTEPGVFRDVKMGDWRYFRPVIKEDKCCQCGWCYLLCPTGCIVYDRHSFTINLDYCKGCGICVEECPMNAMTMAREVV